MPCNCSKPIHYQSITFKISERVILKTFSRLKPCNVFNFVRKAKFVVGLRRAVEFAIGIIIYHVNLRDLIKI